MFIGDVLCARHCDKVLTCIVSVIKPYEDMRHYDFPIKILIDGESEVKILPKSHITSHWFLNMGLYEPSPTLLTYSIAQRKEKAAVASDNNNYYS